MKQCKRCLKNKQSFLFSKLSTAKDGLQSWCKECARLYNLVYGKKYRATEHGKQIRKESDKNYVKTVAGKKARYLATKSFRESHPDRYTCHKRINSAVRRGKIIVGPCSHCGNTYNTEGHHNDYSKPFDVLWLCKECHRKVHQPIT